MQGRKLIEKLNAVDLVVMNGVKQQARFTSYQVAGNSVIDLLSVEHKRVQDVLAVRIWNEDMEVLGDHRIVTMDMLRMDLHRPNERRKTQRAKRRDR